MIQSTLKDETLPAVPHIPGTASVGTIQLTGQCRLMDAMPKGKTNPVLQTMEDLGQTTGFILYRTSL